MNKEDENIFFFVFCKKVNKSEEHKFELHLNYRKQNGDMLRSET